MTLRENSVPWGWHSPAPTEVGESPSLRGSKPTRALCVRLWEGCWGGSGGGSCGGPFQPYGSGFRRPEREPTWETAPDPRRPRGTAGTAAPPRSPTTPGALADEKQRANTAFAALNRSGGNTSGRKPRDRTQRRPESGRAEEGRHAGRADGAERARRRGRTDGRTDGSAAPGPSGAAAPGTPRRPPGPARPPSGTRPLTVPRPPETSCRDPARSRPAPPPATACPC